MAPRDARAWWPCPVDDADNAKATLSRVPWLADWGYDKAAERVWWELLPSELDGAQAAHLRVKQHVQRSISEHAAVGWS
jgi:hypothetical protein